MYFPEGLEDSPFIGSKTIVQIQLYKSVFLHFLGILVRNNDICTYTHSKYPMKKRQIFNYRTYLQSSAILEAKFSNEFNFGFATKTDIIQ